MLFVFLLLFPNISEGVGRGYIEMRGGYKTGGFGTPTRVDLYYGATLLGVVSTAYDVSVTIPYLSVTSDDGDQVRSEGGIGDIILRGGMALVKEGRSGFSIDTALAVKFPTAEENKGLGTGEMDFGAFIGLHQRLEKIKLSLLIGYIKIGDPAYGDYNDIPIYGLGISRFFGKTNLSASLEGRRSLVRGAHNPLEINIGIFHLLTRKYSLRGNLISGLNDGGPDYGYNIGIIRWF